MIIECQTCHARFRLDESRIKGRGARVKCRKCGDSIIVLKDSDPAPPAPGGKDSFDLGSAVRDSSGERTAPPPPSGNLIPFPATSRPAERFAADPPHSAPDATASGKDEVDLAFDRVLSADAEVGARVDREISEGHDSRSELDLGALTLDFRPEETLDLPPAAEQEPPVGESPAPEPSPVFPGEGGFVISDSDTLDFLQEKHREPKPEISPRIDDISLEISSTPIEETTPFPGDDARSTPVGEWTSPSPEASPIEGNATPPAAPVIDVPPHREQETAPMPPAESPVHHGSPAQELTPRSSVGPAVAAVLAVLLAAGAYLGLTTSGRKTLEGVVPGIAKLWGGKPTAPAGPKYDLRNVIGYYESSSASPRILVIKGQVANLSAVEKSGIRVLAALLDNTDTVLAQQMVYAGNVLSGEAIRKGTRDTLSKAMENRFGEGLTNMHVGPGKAIPFMVVFFDAPATMDSYKLEAKDSE